MDKITQERRRTQIFRLAFISSTFILAVVFVTVCLDAYIRWTINKDFTLLGGFELEALTISAFALILGLVYLYRPERSN